MRGVIKAQVFLQLYAIGFTDADSLLANTRAGKQGEPASLRADILAFIYEYYQLLSSWIIHSLE